MNINATVAAALWALFQADQQKGWEESQPFQRWSEASAEDRAPFVFAVSYMARAVRRPPNLNSAAFDLHNAVKAKFGAVPFNTRQAVEIYHQLRALAAIV